MAVFDKGKVKKILTEELGYQQIVAEMTVTALENLHEDLQQHFNAWIETRQEPEYTFRGVSIADILAKRPCDYLNALSTMSAFLKEPRLVEDFQNLDTLIARRRCCGLDE